MTMNEICEAHSEIFHYTTRGGLEGILKSNTLWATHYRSLNDKNEITQLKEKLVEYLRPYIETSLIENQNKSLKERTRILKNGGPVKLARKQAVGLIDSMYKVAYEGGGPSRIRYPEPFITSFCAHSDDYERNNGLLSQWRAYGPGGGFAIVFDTKRLSKLLKHELEQYQITTYFSDVVYDGDDEKFSKTFSNIIKMLPNLYEMSVSNNPDVLTSEDVYYHFIRSCSRFKHRGFKEENEIRITCYPWTEEIISHNKKMQPDVTGEIKPLKMVLMRNENTPYIELFDLEKGMDLPITRIIVGPQRGQDKIKAEILGLVENPRIKIYCSQTPFIEPAAS